MVYQGTCFERQHKLTKSNLQGSDMEAWLFPGQGSQFVGMGSGLPAAEEVFEIANRVLGWDVRAMCAQGPTDRLGETVVSQPAILSVSVAVARALRVIGVVPDAVAGHSVGELSALVACGSLVLDDALRIVDVRAKAMARAGAQHLGAMAAVIGLPEDAVARECASVGDAVVVAAINAPGQVVVSGDAVQVDAASEALRAAGARRVIRLDVSVSAHSPLMRDARRALADAVAAAEVRPPQIPFVSCMTGRTCTQPGEIREVLVAALTEPVRWADTVRALAARGVNRFVEAGPGTVLTGLVRRIDPDAEAFAVGDDATILNAFGVGQAAR